MRTVMQAGEIGRWTAASRAWCSLGAFGAKAVAKGGVGQIDEPMAVGSQLRRLRVRLCAIEHIRDGLALVRRKGRHVDERLHSLIAHRSNDSTGVSVARQHHGARYALQRAVERRHVIGK